MTRSPTQRTLSPDVVSSVVRSATGLAPVRCAELSGGSFATVWRADLADGRAVAVKIGPAPDTPLLEYETGMIGAEARYLSLVEPVGLAMPRVLGWGKGGAVDGEWLVTSFLPGEPLSDLMARDGQVDDSLVRRELGGLIARVHQITGDRFGYAGDRPQGSTWPEAFSAMVCSLLRDAVTWRVALPAPESRVHAALAGSRDVLSAVRRPALLHFDLWDGNVLATVDGAGSAALSGLVDGERYLFGDPLMDFVSPALKRRTEEESAHPFVGGYQTATETPMVFDIVSRHRLALYRLHLYLLMLVEMPSRGMTGPESTARHRSLTRLFSEELDLIDAHLAGGA